LIKVKGKGVKMDKVKNFLFSLLSRKFLLAIAGTIIAYDAVMADGVMTFQELLVVLAPIFSFLGIEGIADIKRSK
jgi:hypothetical protein